MARRRVIDTDGLYFDTELVRLLGYEGLHFYIRLWAIAEDWGGYEFKPDDISLATGALKITPKKVENFCKKLIDADKIIAYSVNGRTYHWLTHFMEHQSLNNPSIPKLPLPDWIDCKIKVNEKTKKKTAQYEIITSKLPVPYQYHTGKPRKDLDLDFDLDKKRKDLDLKGKTEGSKSTPFASLDQPNSTGQDTPKPTPPQPPPKTLKDLQPKGIVTWDDILAWDDVFQGYGRHITQTHIDHWAELGNHIAIRTEIEEMVRRWERPKKSIIN